MYIWAMFFFYAPGVKNISARNHPPFRLFLRLRTCMKLAPVIDGSLHGGVFKYTQGNNSVSVTQENINKLIKSNVTKCHIVNRWV